jgi:hypothetical protein
MKLLLTIFLFLFSLAAYSQQLHIDSTRFITGNKPGTGITYAIPTADKGILFVGNEYGNPGGIIPYFPLDTGVNNNVLVGKIDSNQKISWIKVFGGSKGDGAASVCQTPDGGYAVLAGTESVDGDATGSGYRGGGGDFWLLRIDGSGNLLWEKTYGSSSQDGGISIANTPDGGFIMLGVTNGSDGDVPFHYGGFYTFDWLVIKTDNTGNLQWSRDIGGTGDEQTSGKILAVNDNYYIVSSTTSNDHDCTDSFWHPGVTPAGDNYYLLKLDNAGNVLWDSSYGGSISEVVNDAIFDERDSSIVMTGYSYSHDYMVTDQHGQTDMLVVKVNLDGTVIWHKALGGPEQETGTGICAGPNGGYMIYGSTFPGPLKGEDAWLFALDANGNEISDKIFGGNDAELPKSIVPYLNSYVATGISASNVFNEGMTNGRNCIGEDGFITYFDTRNHEGINIFTATSSAINVYPVPSKNSVSILCPANEKGQLRIINSIGQEVYNRPAKGQQIDIDISGWNGGIYCIVWQSADGGVLTNKLIKY